MIRENPVQPSPPSEPTSVTTTGLDDKEFVRRQAEMARQRMDHNWRELSSRIRTGDELRHWVKRHPVATMGVAAAAGCATVVLFSRCRSHRPRQAKEASHPEERPARSFLQQLVQPVIRDVQKTVTVMVQGILTGLVTECLENLSTRQTINTRSDAAGRSSNPHG